MLGLGVLFVGSVFLFQGRQYLLGIGRQLQ